eukprot:CAMPEP_0115278270 /NCGR_PEP_ID=MMETSP0270-20121206/57669_1 /TAXON_ID=71861 /ORGANISM="Scrippsiella trochoidea, Strain CCMP3099" /LENGTH=488 /DNA_ID=CAMNT_0002694937 /DNA_START=59 /DNA_END=1525 /DNA_ORIENTATION=+
MAGSSARLAIQLLFASALQVQASCPAGEGYPSAESPVCVVCSVGTWSAEGSTECTRCPAGTWSSERGAMDASTCIGCPKGMWSSQEGSPSEASCQTCPPGRWGGTEGLSECTGCSPGTWADQSGATSNAVCTACGAGKWSPQVGATVDTTCMDCAPGTWSNEIGASAQESCTPCSPGTWSSLWGATNQSTCTDCEAGKFQPAVGQASKDVCIRCPPGKYGPMMGAAACAYCPAGSWNGDFAQTECDVCPQGRWMHSRGSLQGEGCAPCPGSGDCLPDGSARITIEFVHFPYAELDSEQMEKVQVAMAEDIAAACSVGNQSVLDLNGKSSSVSVGSDGSVSAFVTEVTKSSASDLASKLYTTTFRSRLVSSTLEILGVDKEHFGAGAISVQPEEFLPVTVTSTTTSVSSTTASTTTSSISDSSSSDSSSANSSDVSLLGAEVSFSARNVTRTSRYHDEAPEDFVLSNAATPAVSLAALLASSGLMLGRI